MEAKEATSTTEASSVCSVCKSSFEGDRTAHRQTKEHIAKKASLCRGGCVVCRVSAFACYNDFVKHTKSQRHKTNKEKETKNAGMGPHQGRARGRGTVLGRGRGTVLGRGRGTVLGRGRGTVLGRGRGTVLGRGRGTVLGRGRGTVLGRGRGTVLGRGRGIAGKGQAPGRMPCSAQDPGAPAKICRKRVGEDQTHYDGPAIKRRREELREEEMRTLRNINADLSNQVADLEGKLERALNQNKALKEEIAAMVEERGRGVRGEEQVVEERGPMREEQVIDMQDEALVRVVSPDLVLPDQALDDIIAEVDSGLPTEVLRGLLSLDNSAMALDVSNGLEDDEETVGEMVMVDEERVVGMEEMVDGADEMDGMGEPDDQEEGVIVGDAIEEAVVVDADEMDVMGEADDQEGVIVGGAVEEAAVVDADEMGGGEVAEIPIRVQEVVRVDREGERSIVDERGEESWSD